MSGRPPHLKDSIVTSQPVTRRDFAAGLALVFPGAALLRSHHVAVPSLRRVADEMTHDNEAIHQTVPFKATPARVYAALTDAAEFDKVVRLSAAMKPGVPAGAPPTVFEPHPGGAFSAFAGNIVGRQIELAPNTRLIQAWRATDWKPGIYSIVRFELSARAGGSVIEFDHTGFPNGQGAHLIEGWRTNYWEPLAKYLAK
jgi:uncharacterized protein YndB with AHSA1/START domain